MKRFKFISLPLLAVAIIFFSACGGDANKSDSSTDSTGGTKDSPTVAAPNTIVTTPQGMVVVTHKVANFEKWLVGYEANDSFKLANGVHNYVVGRAFEDSNLILVVTKVDDMAKAKTFGASADLKKAMQKSGMVGAPTISFF